jgi:hypothetical protein
MKKIISSILLVGLLVVVSGPKPAYADPICTNWGALNVCIPFTTAEGAVGYARLTDPNSGNPTGESQLLVETKLASVKDVALSFGASKGQHFAAAPYLGVGYALPNPVVANSNSGPIAQLLASIQPGVYAGNSNLHKDGWFYGIKTSMKLW